MRSYVRSIEQTHFTQCSHALTPPSLLLPSVPPYPGCSDSTRSPRTSRDMPEAQQLILRTL